MVSQISAADVNGSTSCVLKMGWWFAVETHKTDSKGFGFQRRTESAQKIDPAGHGVKQVPHREGRPRNRRLWSPNADP